MALAEHPEVLRERKIQDLLVKRCKSGAYAPALRVLKDLKRLWPGTDTTIVAGLDANFFD